MQRVNGPDKKRAACARRTGALTKVFLIMEAVRFLAMRAALLSAQNCVHGRTLQHRADAKCIPEKQYPVHQICSCSDRCRQWDADRCNADGKPGRKIGRASCREREESAMVA